MHSRRMPNELWCTTLCEQSHVRLAGEKHGMDLAGKKPIIKATAIKYCQDHAASQEDAADGDEAEEPVAEDAGAEAEEVCPH